MDLTELGCEGVDWIYDTVQWWALVNTILTSTNCMPLQLRGPYSSHRHENFKSNITNLHTAKKLGNSLISWANISFSIRTLLHRVGSLVIFPL
jgi:hypothetical protein